MAGGSPTTRRTAPGSSIPARRRPLVVTDELHRRAVAAQAHGVVLGRFRLGLRGGLRDPQRAGEAAVPADVDRARAVGVATLAPGVARPEPHLRADPARRRPGAPARRRGELAVGRGGGAGPARGRPRRGATGSGSRPRGRAEGVGRRRRRAGPGAPAPRADDRRRARLAAEREAATAGPDLGLRARGVLQGAVEVVEPRHRDRRRPSGLAQHDAAAAEAQDQRGRRARRRPCAASTRRRARGRPRSPGLAAHDADRPRDFPADARAQRRARPGRPGGQRGCPEHGGDEEEQGDVLGVAWPAPLAARRACRRGCRSARHGQGAALCRPRAGPAHRCRYQRPSSRSRKTTRSRPSTVTTSQ